MYVLLRVFVIILLVVKTFMFLKKDSFRNFIDGMNISYNTSMPVYLPTKFQGKYVSNLKNDDPRKLTEDTSAEQNRRKRVLGGEECDINDYQYYVSFQTYSPEQGSYDHICSGSLVDKDWVLTSGTCCTVLDDDDRVVLGANAPYVELEDGSFHGNPGVKNSLIKKLYAHEKFNTFTNDICLVLLHDEIKESSSVKYAKLSTDNYLCDRGVLMGFGMQNNYTVDRVLLDKEMLYENFLPCVKLNIEDSKECAKLGLQEFSQKKMFCTKTYPGIDACFADEGAPLVCGKTQIGISSYSFGCGIGGSPRAFTKVAAFKHWMKRVKESRNKSDMLFRARKQEPKDETTVDVTPPQNLTMFLRAHRSLSNNYKIILLLPLSTFLFML